MRQTSYLGILLKVTILILSLIQTDNIILYQALGLQGQKEEEALGLPLFISCILFFYIVLYCPSIILALYYIVPYYLVLSRYYIILSQHYSSIILYCPSIILALYYIVLLLLLLYYIILLLSYIVLLLSQYYYILFTIY